MADVSTHLTIAEHNAISAVQNEDGNVQDAYDNASSYAEQWEMTIAEFRLALKSVFGFEPLATNKPRVHNHRRRDTRCR